MRVFLSWSGQRSRMVASALHQLLPSMLHSVTCWMSDNDIPKGKPWFEELTRELNTIVFAVVCVTKENLKSPWMLWESGFLSSASKLGDRHIVPLALGMKKDSLGGPLAVYQAADTSRDDFLRVVRRINESVEKERQIALGVLETTFGYVWPDLERQFKAAEAAVVDETPTPPEPAPVLQAEILALLRQQQRETANLTAVIDQLANASVLPLSHSVTPGSGALTLASSAPAASSSLEMPLSSTFTAFRDLSQQPVTLANYEAFQRQLAELAQNPPNLTAATKVADASKDRGGKPKKK